MAIEAWLDIKALLDGSSPRILMVRYLREQPLGSTRGYIALKSMDVASSTADLRDREARKTRSYKPCFNRLEVSSTIARRLRLSLSAGSD